MIGCSMAARIRLLLVALLALAASSVAAQQGTYTIDDPSGKWKAVRVRNVPEGALLAIAFFRGQAVKRLSFSVTAPVTGHYYVVLDNRKGGESLAVEVTIAARKRQPPKKGPAEPRPPARPRREDLSSERRLHAPRELGSSNATMADRAVAGRRGKNVVAAPEVLRALEYSPSTAGAFPARRNGARMPGDVAGRSEGS